MGQFPEMQGLSEMMTGNVFAHGGEGWDWLYLQFSQFGFSGDPCKAQMVLMCQRMMKTRRPRC